MIEGDTFPKCNTASYGRAGFQAILSRDIAAKLLSSRELARDAECGVSVEQSTGHDLCHVP
jgi:hypothetical protein